MQLGTSFAFKSARHFMNQMIKILATGLGVGYLPKAPGTWGTLLALPLGFFLLPSLQNDNLWLYPLTLITFIVMSIWIADKAQKILKINDASQIVIDEIAGCLVASAYIPATWLNILIAFILFRIADIFKPPPARFIQEKWKNGLGIVGDDLVAGLYVCLILHMGLKFI